MKAAASIDERGSQGLSDAQLWKIENDRSEALATQPPYDSMIATVVDCWYTLDSCRAIGMAVGPIPATAVWDWCERKHLDEEITKAIAEAINHLDADRRKREAIKRAHPKSHTKSRP